jgi:hypothetical protein
VLSQGRSRYEIGAAMALTRIKLASRRSTARWLKFASAVDDGLRFERRMNSVQNALSIGMARDGITPPVQPLRCRLDSNNDPELHRLKQAAADLFDLCQAIPSSRDGEANALAQTAVEEASLHGVLTARSDGG